jgi:hypothetical protein
MLSYDQRPIPQREDPDNSPSPHQVPQCSVWGAKVGANSPRPLREVDACGGRVGRPFRRGETVVDTFESEQF